MVFNYFGAKFDPVARKAARGICNYLIAILYKTEKFRLQLKVTCNQS